MRGKLSAAKDLPPFGGGFLHGKSRREPKAARLRVRISGPGIAFNFACCRPFSTLHRVQTVSYTGRGL